MPAKIKSLHLKNYCGYLDTKLDFTDSGDIKPLALFFGANGVGKSSILNAINLLGNAYQYENKDSSLSFRRLTYSTNYDPSYTELQYEYAKEEGNDDIPDSKKMRLTGVFELDGEERTVILTSDGVEVNELPRNHNGHSYYIDADNPMNMRRFQLENNDYADLFLELAEVVYNFPCYFDKSIKVEDDEGNEIEMITDFVIEKWGTHVHYKSMSDGEKKIAGLLRKLCNEEYMQAHDMIEIDNSVMHIYFKRHKRLVDLLIEKFPNKQFLMTTHSGILINHVDEKYHYDLEEYKKKELKKFNIAYQEG